MLVVVILRTNLFFESCAVKFLDIVRLKTLELMFKNKSCPECIHPLFLS